MRWSVERVAVAAGVLFLLALLGLALAPEPVAPTPPLEAMATTSPAPSATAAASPMRTSIPTGTPYPTAQDPLILGSDPPIARTVRGDLTVDLQAPDQALAGEVVSVTLILYNPGPTYIMITYASVELVGEPAFSEGAWRGTLENREWRLVVEPRSTYTTTLPVLIPPDGLRERHELWGTVEVEIDDGDLNRVVVIETGPLQIEALAPPAERALSAQLSVGEQGWAVTLQVPTLPAVGAWGVLETTFEDGTTSYQWLGGLRWAGEWDGRAAPVSARALVAAPGYASAIVSATLPGRSPPPPSQMQVATFSSLAEASAYAGFAPLQITGLEGAILESVTVISSTAGGPEPINMNMIQTYRTAEGSWVELNQFHYGGSLFFGEVQPVKVGAVTGQAARHFGRWIVEWHLDLYPTILTAPAPNFLLEELLRLAESVR
jgi:hypothetical protein